MTHFPSGNVPGLRPAAFSHEEQIAWSGRGGLTFAATRKAMLDAANEDPGNTPATTLRAGWVLALDDATGRAVVYAPDANDGRQIAHGVLEQTHDMLVDGVPTDRFTQLLVHGLVREATLRGLDVRARSQLAGRLVFDRTLAAGPFHCEPRGVYRHAENYTLSAADHGLLLVATAAVAFTLPAKQNGLSFRFAQTADANLAIVGAGDLVHKGSATADSVTFGTADQKIGSHALVECLYVAEGTLKWLVTNLGGTTATVA